MADEDKDQGANDQQTQPSASTDDDKAKAAATGDATGANQNGGEERRFTQAEVDQIVRERLEREKRKAEEAAAKAREEAEKKALEEQGKYRELAEKHEQRIKELEPYQAKAERYEAALKAQLEAARKDLPAHIISLLDKLDPVEQLEWIAANREALTPKTTTPIPASPPAKEPTMTEDEKRRRAVSARGYW